MHKVSHLRASHGRSHRASQGTAVACFDMKTSLPVAQQKEQGQGQLIRMRSITAVINTVQTRLIRNNVIGKTRKDYLTLK
jgi:hypothetical protein